MELPGVVLGVSGVMVRNARNMASAKLEISGGTSIRTIQ